ncbi:MAG: hypothetical protein ACI8PT_000955 [Gammaproteobacteria bacterium]|jgi:hypothetical protein
MAAHVTTRLAIAVAQEESRTYLSIRLCRDRRARTNHRATLAPPGVIRLNRQNGV